MKVDFVGQRPCLLNLLGRMPFMQLRRAHKSKKKGSDVSEPDTDKDESY